MSFQYKGRLPQIKRDLRQRAAQLVKQTAFEIEAQAKLLAPVKTGFLRNSIQTEMTGEMEATIGPAAEYAIFIELGTSRRAARPFLSPAIEGVRAKFEAGLKNLLS